MRSSLKPSLYVYAHVHKRMLKSTSIIHSERPTKTFNDFLKQL